MAEKFRKSPRRVAVASKTGVLIDECFGRAENYRIYELADEGYRLAELRPGPAPCRDQSHDPQILGAAVALLADCDMVLAGRIGPEAIRQLSKQGVVGLAAHIGIQDALDHLAKR
ncbi:MAG: dinitrogenase iron-molybdenum cofactor biosynthesis protein [Candidatus Adiutrix sp.]|jgi:predicted Fe-Mo cluster-binding NifX family protein|nr:dinitrogenase iron-molybdenum cofactor biosynthesis protein [Candidatus Adiutrix sp.]